MTTAFLPSELKTYRHGLEPLSLWSALTEDSNVPVMILDADAGIEYANPAAATLLGVPVAEAVGHSLADYFGDEVVRDRVAFIADVLAADRPVAVDGMIRGRFTRTIYRPFRDGGTTADRVLVTTRTGDYRDPKVHPATIPALRARVDDHGLLAALTTREMEILRLIGMGLSTAGIAKKLARSVKTVEWHRVSLGEKLAATNRVELARIAIAAGIVGTEAGAHVDGEVQASK